MKKFKFRLETILKLKEKALEEKMLELAKVTKLINDTVERLNKVVESREQISSDLINIYKSGKCLDLQEIQSHKDYLVKLTENIAKHEHLIEQLNNARRQKQDEVYEALKEKNILEKLKEKQSEKHYKELEQKQAIELDDITISRYKAV